MSFYIQKLIYFKLMSIASLENHHVHEILGIQIINIHRGINRLA